MIDLQPNKGNNNSLKMHNLNALERIVHCAGCEKAIQERFLLNVLGRPWHAECVQCSDCCCSLSEKCFSRDGKLFCREDFFRRFGTKCGGCAQGISPNDLVRRARDKVFHLKCFTCMVCRKQLSTGEELYVLDENKFICKEDYLNSKYSQVSDDEDDLMDKLDGDLSDKSSFHDDDDSIDSGFPPLHGLTNSHQQTTTSPGSLSGLDLHPHHHIPGGGTHPHHQQKVNDINDLNNKNNAQNNQLKIKEEQLDNNDNPKSDMLMESKSDTGSKGDSKGECSDTEESTKGGKGAKRRGPRTTIKAKQLETLKAAFAATPKPTRHIREQLAQETGLNMRVIQVWFQNRRSKERRMKQLSALGARRAFFRNPRRMRGMPDDSPDLLGQPGFNFYPDGDFYPGPGFPGGYPGDFPFQGEGNMNFLPPTSGPVHPMMDQMTGHMGVPHDFGMVPPPGHQPGDMGLPPSSNTPEPGVPTMQALDAFNGMPPRSNNFNVNQNNVLDHRPGQEMHTGDAPWL